ncbi:hypothetical protein [Thalassococcus lentus]|uniref:Uncharacterized protein n=1 Tax=Thalassococcus lentus TaxID=1210524 RepID=A0ABT4XS98_9RHOB|nr:hypothetical protein [Thalassococcus lentus]MDA7424834.1 hypothetical protein [Thalassococcus lentus]
MKHEPFAPKRLTDLKPVEARLITLLRHVNAHRAPQRAIWSDLRRDMTFKRARSCWMAASNMLDLLNSHGWQPAPLSAPRCKLLSQHEQTLVLFVLSATEQRREEAMEQALFLIQPHKMPELVKQAERLGMPLLCADCKRRILGDRTLTFQ